MQTTGDADVQLVADFVRRLRRVALHPLAQPKIKADQPWPLVDSRWSFRDQTLSLLESAKYVQDDEGDDDE